MARYRYQDPVLDDQEFLLIEDPSLFRKASDHGSWEPGFRFVDETTVRVHPALVAGLLTGLEPVWSLEEVLAPATAHA